MCFRPICYTLILSIKKPSYLVYKYHIFNTHVYLSVLGGALSGIWFRIRDIPTTIPPLNSVPFILVHRSQIACTFRSFRTDTLKVKSFNCIITCMSKPTQYFFKITLITQLTVHPIYTNSHNHPLKLETFSSYY